MRKSGHLNENLIPNSQYEERLFLSKEPEKRSRLRQKKINEFMVKGQEDSCNGIQ